MPKMQQDSFIEQMVKRGTKQKDNIRRAFIVLGGLIILSIPWLIGFNAVYFVEPVLIMVVGLAVWILWRRASREYEYIYTEGLIDIDVVFGRSSRKHLFSIDARKATLIAPALNPKAKEETEGKSFDRKIFACEGDIKDDTYVLIGEYMSRKYLVYWEPDERILDGIKHYAPRHSIIRPEDLKPKKRYVPDVKIKEEEDEEFDL